MIKDYNHENDPIPIISGLYIDLLKMCYEGIGYYLLDTNNEIEYKNYYTINPVMNGDWLSSVESMGKWYEQNIHTYQDTLTGKASGHKGWYDCPLIHDKVADDCSGFVQACLKLAGVNCPTITTTVMQSQQFMSLMKDSGFTHIEWSGSEDILQPGDIMCGGPGTHTEIFAGIIDGRKKSWSWGNIHDGKNGHSPLPCGFYMKNRKHIWRKV